MASSKEYKRAARLRKRRDGGGRPLYAEELEWLAAYDAARGTTPQGTSIEEADPDDDADDTKPPADGTVPSGAPGPDPVPSGSGVGGPSADPKPQEVPIVPPPAPPPPKLRALPAPPLPVPPRAARDDQKDDDGKGRDGKAGGGWRDKYRSGGGTHSGRESACVYIGSLWHGGLKQMEQAITEAGIKPVIDVDKLAGPIVLALDEILPPDFVVTPTMVAVGGSTALTMQRFLRRKEIADKQAQAAFVASARDGKRAAESKPSVPTAPTSAPVPPVAVEPEPAVTSPPVVNGHGEMPEIREPPPSEAEREAAHQELFGVGS